MSSKQGAPHITVISTYAQDIIKDLTTEHVEKKRGGGAHWIEKVYTELGVSFDMVTGQDDAVTTVFVENGTAQYGMLNEVHDIVIEEELHDDGFLINTMQDEFNLNQVAKLEGAVMVDIAGFTREGERGTVQKTCSVIMPPKEVREKITIIKANEHEYPCMSQEWIDEQQNERIMLHTLGAGGVDLWIRGELVHIDAPETKPKNTLGAGDTFGAVFLYEYLANDGDAEQACHKATEAVGKLFADRPVITE